MHKQRQSNAQHSTREQHVIPPTLAAAWSLLPPELTPGVRDIVVEYALEIEGALLPPWPSALQHNYPHDINNTSFVVASDETMVFVVNHDDDTTLRAFCKHDGSNVLGWWTGVRGPGVIRDYLGNMEGAFAADDTCIYATVPEDDSVVVLDKATGSFVRDWGCFGSGTSEFKEPVSIAVDATHVFVGDQENHRVQVFLKSNGTFVRQWGKNGKGQGEFNMVAGVAVDATHVFVVDCWNNRVQVFLKDDVATFAREFGSHGRANGQFHWPQSIAVNTTHVFVADKGGIQMFEKTNGAFVKRIGVTDRDAWSQPMGIVADDSRVIASTATRDTRIDVYI